MWSIRFLSIQKNTFWHLKHGNDIFVNININFKANIHKTSIQNIALQIEWIFPLLVVSKWKLLIEEYLAVVDIMNKYERRIIVWRYKTDNKLSIKIEYVEHYSSVVYFKWTWILVNVEYVLNCNLSNLTILLKVIPMIFSE